MKNILRIVPPAKGDFDSCVMTHGTKFVLPNGAELGGVVRFEVIGEADNVYRCNLEIICQAPETFSEITQIVFKRPPVWQRVIEWITGVQVREVTDMRTTEYRRFEMAKNAQ